MINDQILKIVKGSLMVIKWLPSANVEQLFGWDDGWLVDGCAVDRWITGDGGDGCSDTSCEFSWYSKVVWLSASSVVSLVAVIELSFRERFIRLRALLVFAGAIGTSDWNYKTAKWHEYVGQYDGIMR